MVNEPLADEVRALLVEAMGACERVATPSAGTAAAYFSGWALTRLRGFFDVEGLRRLVPPTVLRAGAAVVGVLAERGQRWEDGAAFRAAAVEAVRPGCGPGGGAARSPVRRRGAHCARAPARPVGPAGRTPARSRPPRRRAGRCAGRGAARAPPAPGLALREVNLVLAAGWPATPCGLERPAPWRARQHRPSRRRPRRPRQCLRGCARCSGSGGARAADAHVDARASGAGAGGAACATYRGSSAAVVLTRPRDRLL